MASSFGATPNQSQRRIAEEICELERRLLQLKAEFNGRAAVSKLPPEVLSEIFVLLARSLPLESWYRINLVCRHWRCTALATAALWSTLSTGCHELALLMLQRSQMADLDIHFTLPTPLATRAAVLAHLRRIRSLHVVNPGRFPEIFNGLRNLKNDGLFRLTELNVTVDYDTDKDILIPHDHRFDWVILPLPALTHLNLQGIFLAAPITIRVLLSTLREMPNLQLFLLQCDIISNEDSFQIAASNPVELPHLFVFKVNASIIHPHVVHLLSHLRLPQLTNLCIYLSGTVSGTSAEGAIHPEFSPLLDIMWFLVAHGNFELEALDAVEVSADLSFHLHSQHEVKCPNTLWQGVELKLVEYDGFDNTTQCFTYEVLRTLDPGIRSRLVELKFYDSDLPVEVIYSPVNGLPNIEFLTISPGVLDIFSRILSVPFDHTGLSNFPRPQTLLPKLKAISIMPRSSAEHLDHPPTVQDFCESLRTRYHHGAPIHTLYLRTRDLLRHPVLNSLVDIGIEILQCIRH